jgi:ABC-type glycerol-3-phosphate transport system substrate-binding protein
MAYCHTVPIHLTPIFKSMLEDPAYLGNERIKKWKPWHDVMLTALKEKRLLPLGFTRPEDNLLPFLAELDGSSIVADMVVEVMVGQKPPKAEADRAQKRAEELLTQLGHKRW